MSDDHDPEVDRTLEENFALEGKIEALEAQLKEERALCNEVAGCLDAILFMPAFAEFMRERRRTRAGEPGMQALRKYRKSREESRNG